MRLDLHIAVFPLPPSPAVSKGIYTICRRRYMTTSVSDCSDLNDTFLQLPKAARVILVESQDDLVTSRLVYDTFQLQLDTRSNWATQHMVQFSCRVSICLRHRCRVGARSADCNSHPAATGIHHSQPSPTRQLCFVAGKLPFAGKVRVQPTHSEQHLYVEL